MGGRVLHRLTFFGVSDDGNVMDTVVTGLCVSMRVRVK